MHHLIAPSKGSSLIELLHLFFKILPKRRVDEMKMNGLIFVIGFVLAFAGGYLFLGTGSADEAQETPTPTATEEGSSESEDTDAESTEDDSDQEAEEESADADVTLDADTEALARNNCLSCHAVEEAGLDGGTTGPDLSNAYGEVEGKHGKTLDEFLQEPTSAVMSSVIEEDPLEDDEREKIVELLKEVSELD